MEYSFEHGIDHCGQYGIAPILVVGGPLTERDFSERDLSSIKGVRVSQPGMAKGLRWKDLNLKLLFRELGPIEYFQAEFKGVVDLGDLGEQAKLKYLFIECPGAKPGGKGLFPSLQYARVHWPDICTTNLIGSSLIELELIRPEILDLTDIGHLKDLRKLDVWYAKALSSLKGIEFFRSLDWLGLHDCPSIAHTGLATECLGPEELMVGGCRAFVNFAGLEFATRLKKLSVLGGAKEIFLRKKFQQQLTQMDVNPSMVTFT